MLQSHLGLLERRVREHMIGDNTTEQIMESLAAICTGTDDLLRLSGELNVPQAFWNGDGTLASKIGQFVAKITDLGKLELLVETVGLQHPELLKQ